MSDELVLCGASAYDRKYYFNEAFAILPQRVKDELQILCVTFTEQCGGILTLVYEPEGTLALRTEARDGDVLYDEIGAGLEIKRMQGEHRELFRSLELFYQVFAGGGEA